MNTTHSMNASLPTNSKGTSFTSTYYRFKIPLNDSATAQSLFNTQTILESFIYDISDTPNINKLVIELETPFHSNIEINSSNLIIRSNQYYNGGYSTYRVESFIVDCTYSLNPIDILSSSLLNYTKYSSSSTTINLNTNTASIIHTTAMFSNRSAYTGPSLLGNYYRTDTFSDPSEYVRAAYEKLPVCVGFCTHLQPYYAAFHCNLSNYSIYSVRSFQPGESHNDNYPFKLYNSIAVSIGVSTTDISYQYIINIYAERNVYFCGYIGTRTMYGTSLYAPSIYGNIKYYQLE